MPDVSKALGFGTTFEFKGKTYQLKPWTYKVQMLFEQYLQAEARKAARAMREYLTPHEYQQLLQDVTRDVAGGYYAFGGEAVQTALSALPHAQHLFYLCLAESHPEATPELVREMFDEKMAELMAAMDEANSDPNPPSREAPAGV